MKLIKSISARFAAIIVASGFALSAHATQINGTIGFTSAMGSTGGTIAPAGGGNFTVNFNNPMHVNFSTDDYLGTNGSSVNFASFTFNGSTGALVSPNIPEWTFTIGTTTYSFDLLSTKGSFLPGNPNSLAIMGEGTAHITGLDDTFATFSLQGTGKGFTFTILQASNTAVPTPDSGSAVALLGFGLVAIEGLRRKLATA